MTTEASQDAAAPSSPTSKTAPEKNSKKRSSPSGDSEQPEKITKRRAARACVSCRARKVRCDVVEGAPCGNCRWDNVEVRLSISIVDRQSQQSLGLKAVTDS